MITNLDQVDEAKLLGTDLRRKQAVLEDLVAMEGKGQIPAKIRNEVDLDDDHDFCFNSINGQIAGLKAKLAELGVSTDE